jgi:hypothetical protein
MQVPYWLTYMTSLLKSGKSLNISGDQTGRVKHRSGEHMNSAIDCYIHYALHRAATGSRLGQIQLR